jgi:hypothetical protein
MYTSTSISLLPFRSKHRPDATMGSCNDSLPRCPSESSPPLHKLQLPLSLPIPIRWSFSTHGNQSKLSRHSFTTTGHSNSEIHRIGHPFSIKWLHMSDLSTPRILPPPFAILQASPTATTSTAEPPPLILTVERLRCVQVWPQSDASWLPQGLSTFPHSLRQKSCQSRPVKSSGRPARESFLPGAR